MRRVSTMLAVVAALSGCSSVQDTKAAQAAIDAFHRQLNGGQFQPIYDAASADMKGATAAGRSMRC